MPIQILNSNGSPEQTYARQQLAAAITAKGVETDPKAPFNVMAEKVRLIPQESYTIDGGDLYEKQMFGGVTESVEPYVQTGAPLWNLYEVMVTLLSDSRFSNYGGILLAEYYKGYDTIELMNAGASGAYFTCDGDFYTTDKAGGNAHVWHDGDNGMANRWVAYLFAVPQSNYTIPSTELCPRSIHIGRSVGTIINAYEGRITEIVCTDGNSYTGTNFNLTNPWQKNVTLRGIKEHRNGVLLRDNNNVVFASIDITESYTQCVHGRNSIMSYIEFPHLTSINGYLMGGDAYNEFGGNPEIHIPKLKTLNGGSNGAILRTRTGGEIKLYLDSLEECNNNGIMSNANDTPKLTYLYIGYSENDASKAIVLSWFLRVNYLADIELKQGFRKPLTIMNGINLSREILREHIIDRLGDNNGNPTIRISLNSVNLAALTEEDIQVATDKNYTLA